ncbi:MAG TPA: hypothetical protein PKE69_09230 [Pyrinomonadaceae bacterium]|nr:hypothetical protein [Pyrinomonadaceae bacterium]
MKNPDFVKRLVEICGTSQPQVACQKLDISYQAAKNYLSGRLPNIPALIQISEHRTSTAGKSSEKTSCSIHWLLTGKGDKFVSFDRNEDTLRLSAEMREFIRQECLELVKEVIRGDYQENATEKVVVLNSGNIKEEKINEDAPLISSSE